jgi:hypothetical protein
MLPPKKTNVNECIEGSSTTRSADNSAVMQTNVPHLYTDNIHRYGVETFIKKIKMVKIYKLWPGFVISHIIHLVTKNVLWKIL